MFRIVDPRPVQPLDAAEARRILADLDHAMTHDPLTRMLAFRVATSARRGRSCPLLVLVAGLVAPTATDEPPKDAA